MPLSKYDLLLKKQMQLTKLQEKHDNLRRSISEQKIGADS